MHKHFHVPNKYFLSHSVGCLPVTTPAFMQSAFFDTWGAAGGNAWPAWLEILNDFRAALAAYLGAAQSDICPQTNVSSALTKIFYSLPQRTGRKVIVLSPNDFPTIGFALKQAERAGYKLQFVKGDITDAQNWKDAMDDSVHLVHITHAISNTSELLPVGKICKLAKDKGIFSVVDIAQSVGAVPIHIPNWQPDFVIGTSVKFLCGGPGACFLYAAPSVVGDCAPIDVGWFSHENPFEMDIHNFRYAPDALRFFGGTPSSAPFASALGALNIWQAIGSENVYKRVQEQLTDLSGAVPSAVLISPKNPGTRGGTLVISPQDRTPLRAALAVAHIQHDERNEGFRFSVHGYTPPQDVDALKQVFKSVF